MSDHKFYDDQGNVIMSLDTSFPFTNEMTLDSNNTLTNPLDVPVLHGDWTIKDGMYNGQMFAVGKTEVEPNIQFKLAENEILRVTAEGEFIWCDDADNVIANGDFSNSPSMKHILMALREWYVMVAGI